jgi:hypothetical protein
MNDDDNSPQHSLRKRPGQSRQESSGEPTFADVLNSLSFDRTSRKRRPKQESVPADTPVEPTQQSEQESTQPWDTASAFELSMPGVPVEEPEPDLDEREDSASIVRAYAWTRGRTKSDYHLEIETLISTTDRGRNPAALVQAEYRSVATLCAHPRSVAEVAALLSLPLGIAKVLLGDMAGLGLVTVHETASAAGNMPDLALMERVLSGLHRLECPVTPMC